jgi:hypothetical protein
MALFFKNTMEANEYFFITSEVQTRMKIFAILALIQCSGNFRCLAMHAHCKLLERLHSVKTFKFRADYKHSHGLSLIPLYSEDTKLDCWSGYEFALAKSFVLLPHWLCMVYNNAQFDDSRYVWLLILLILYFLVINIIDMIYYTHRYYTLPGHSNCSWTVLPK